MDVLTHTVPFTPAEETAQTPVEAPVEVVEVPAEKPAR